MYGCRDNNSGRLISSSLSRAIIRVGEGLFASLHLRTSVESNSLSNAEDESWFGDSFLFPSSRQVLEKDRSELL